MAFWKKKGVTIGEDGDNPAEQEIEEVGGGKVVNKFGRNVDIELAKIQGKLDSLTEMRKATAERFSLITEQLGEVRGSINDMTQQFSKVEVEATKAIDKVDSVQPETFMTELRKGEGRIDALKANIESNESLMHDLLDQLKEIRHKMDVYKGTEQIIKLHEEIKSELANIKKVEGTVERHANRVETIFLDVEKKFSEFDQFNSSVKELTRGFSKIQADFEKIRVKVDTKSDKKEFVDLLNKFNDFEKHTGNIIKLLDERSKHAKDDLKNAFNQIKIQLEKKFDVKINVEPSIQTAEKKTRGGFFKRKKSEKEAEKEFEEESESEGEVTPPTTEPDFDPEPKTKQEEVIADFTKETN